MLIDEYQYTEQEIGTVFELLNATTNKTYQQNSSKYLEICYQLLWCYISGSEQAFTFLLEAEEKFGKFYGSVASEYKDIINVASRIEDYKKFR